MSAVWMLTNNYVDSDVISNAYESSEQAAFPASNVYNKQRRSKVWRSNGYWEITSSNNVLIFQETAAVNLTATITADEYTSTTALLAAIKTALEAAGASTYTVSQDATTGKIKIVSDGGGGGGIFSLMTSDAGCTMAATLGFDTSVDKTGSLTVLADVLRISTGEWLKWDFGISSNPKVFALIGPRNQPIRISPDATIKLQGNETDAWSSPSYEVTLTYNDLCILKVDSDGLHTEALRYWRLLIEDLDNPLGYVEVGCVYLGDLYTTTRGACQFPFRAKQVDRSTTVFSEGGQTFSDIREKTQEFSCEWFGLTITEAEALVAIFDEVGTSIPFFILYDVNSAFSSSANYACRFVKFSSEPLVELVSPGNFRMTMELREEL